MQDRSGTPTKQTRYVKVTAVVDVIYATVEETEEDALRMALRSFERYRPARAILIRPQGTVKIEEVKVVPNPSIRLTSDPTSVN